MKKFDNFTMEDKNNALKKLKLLKNGINANLTKQEIRSLDYKFQYELYKKNVNAFSRDFLNLYLYPHMLSWINFINNNKYSLIQAPRDHGKSETIGHVFVTHQIAYNHNIRILFISATVSSVSMKSLRQVRQELSQNEELGWFFGKQFDTYKGIWLDNEYYFHSKSNVWTKTEFQVSRDKVLKEPTVTAIGVGTEVLGGHYDLIIADDIVTRKNCRTETKRNEIKGWFTDTILPLLEDNKDSKLIVIGTPKHYDDLYATLEKNSVFNTKKDKAIIEGDINDNNIFYFDKKVIDDQALDLNVKFYNEEDKKNYKILWNYDNINNCGKTIENLLITKFMMDSVEPGKFMKEYQCELTDEKFDLFPITWLNGIKLYDKSYINKFEGNKYYDRSNFIIVLQSIDLSVIDSIEKAEQNDSDYTVITTIGVDKEFNKHILHIFRRRGLTPKELKFSIKELYNNFHPDIVIMENVAFQNFLVSEIKSETDIPIIGHHTSSNKYDEFGVIPALRFQIENKKILFPYKTNLDRQITDIVLTEIHQYQKAKHDDTVMSLWFALYFLATNKIAKRLRIGIKDRPKRIRSKKIGLKKNK